MRSRRPKPTALAVAVLAFSSLAVPPSAWAQAQTEEPDPLETARVRLGSFAFTPAVFMTGGYDSNVIRTSVGEPDWELVTSPQIDAWMGFGSTRLNINSAVELTNHTKDPPVTFNYYNGLLFTVPGVAFKPTLSYSHINLYARPTGYEIGERSRRNEHSAAARLDWRGGSRATLSAEGSWLKIDWDGAAEYQGSGLQTLLNRTSTSGLFEGDIQVTPLTSLSAGVRVIRDRFEFSPERDGVSLDVLGGVSFSDLALISGSAVVGYRRFQSRDSGAEDFNGVIYLGQLRYVRESRTQILLDFSRLPYYSFSEELGYYLLTSTSGAFIQALRGDWEVRVFGGYHLLDYRVAGLATGSDETTRRTDVGSGVSRRFGQFTRIGLNASYISSQGGEIYQAWRATAFIVYGSDKLKRLDRPLPDER